MEFANSIASARKWEPTLRRLTLDEAERELRALQKVNLNSAIGGNLSANLRAMRR
jgi:hypothetical protein